MRDFGGPLKGGMPLYKYVGNRILTVLRTARSGMNLSEFHSGFRAYNLHALREIDFSHMTDDFHFDTEIIIKLNHQGFRIHEVPIPTYYGGEICYVNGTKYAWDVARAVRRYHQTRRSIKRHPEFQEFFVHYPVKTSSHSSHAYLREAVGRNHDVLDIGCGEGLSLPSCVSVTIESPALTHCPCQSAAMHSSIMFMPTWTAALRISPA